MNLETVAQLIGLMEQSSLSVLEVEDNGIRVRMECRRETFGAAPAGNIVLPKLTSSALSVALPEAPEAAEETQTHNEGEQPPGHSELSSPMVGTFHELKNPVKVGASLKAGDPVCIIEAMKVMNEIVMEEDGVISWIACEEGDMVEYGQVLFTYQ